MGGKFEKWLESMKANKPEWKSYHISYVMLKRLLRRMISNSMGLASTYAASATTSFEGGDDEESKPEILRLIRAETRTASIGGSDDMFGKVRPFHQHCLSPLASSWAMM